MMKRLNKIHKKLNDLLMLNYEAEKIYLEALDLVKDENLKKFFRERGFERNECGKQLRSEIRSLGCEPRTIDDMSHDYYRIWIKFKHYLQRGDNESMLQEIRKIKEISINAYDEVLRLHKLPAAVCKKLIDQRDKIETAMNSIRLKERLVA